MRSTDFNPWKDPRGLGRHIHVAIGGRNRCAGMMIPSVVLFAFIERPRDNICLIGASRYSSCGIERLAINISYGIRVIGLARFNDVDGIVELVRIFPAMGLRRPLPATAAAIRVANCLVATAAAMAVLLSVYVSGPNCPLIPPPSLSRPQDIGQRPYDAQNVHMSCCHI